MPMERVKQVFAFLGLVWALEILFHLAFPRTWLTWYTYCESVFIHLSGAMRGDREYQFWLMAFFLVPACLILLIVFAGIGVKSVVARAIRKDLL